jgi:hypothetical protein
MTHAEPEIASETPPTKMAKPNRRQGAQVEEHDYCVNDQDGIGKNRIDKGHSDEWVLRERKFPDNPSADQMLLNNSLQDFRGARVVPDGFGIDDRDRAMRADSKAIRLGAINQRVRSNQVQFFQAFLQKLPRFESFFFRSAFGFGLIRA